MSRLYYDQPVPGEEAKLISRKDGAKNYLEKVAKLVPSEVLAAYMTMVGLVASIRKVPEAHHFWMKHPQHLEPVSFHQRKLVVELLWKIRLPQYLTATRR